jgi:hypothetical protein
MMEKMLLGSSYLAQAIVMATIAFAVISTIYYLRYNKKIICQPGCNVIKLRKTEIKDKF